FDRLPRVVRMRAVRLGHDHDICQPQRGLAGVMAGHLARTQRIDQNDPLDSQRAACDFPQPVRTADTAITGTSAASIVRCAPSSTKSAPAASTREARCITCAWLTSLYENTTLSTRSPVHSASSSGSATIGMPCGYRALASDAG